jgi:hypothetical protein
VLSGASKDHGCLWTSLAQVYPNKLGSRRAESLTSAAVDRKYLKVVAACSAMS